MTGTFRKLTAKELAGYANEMAEEVFKQSVREYALDVYGPKAHKVYLEYGSEYNDEGGYYTTFESISVVDKDGNDLEVAETFPATAKAKSEWMKHYGFTEPLSEVELDDAVSEYRGEVLDLGHVESPPTTIFVYEIPNFPSLFVEE